MVGGFQERHLSRLHLYPGGDRLRRVHQVLHTSRWVILTGTEGLSLATSYYLDSERVFIILYAAFQALLIYLPMIEVASPEPENERIVLVFFGAIIMGLGKALALWPWSTASP